MDFYKGDVINHGRQYHAAASKNIPQAKEKLHSIMMKFKLFLEDAIQYYVDLYNRLDSYFGFSNEHAKNSLHKCLIILGDLGLCVYFVLHH